MPTERASKNRAFFLCSPNLGILDSWLPVLVKLKSERRLELTLVVSRASVVEEMDRTNVLIHLASSLFSRIVFRDHRGDWRCATDFESAKAIVNRTRIYEVIDTWLMRILRRDNLLQRRRGGAVLRDLLGFSEGDPVVLLYDIHEDSKEYNAEIKELFRQAAKFSLSYSNWIFGADPRLRPAETALLRQWVGRAPVSVFAYSHRQLDFYSSVVPSGCVKTVGFPRHDPWWIETIVRHDTLAPLPFEAGYILVISRPGNTERFPAARKRRALLDVQQLAQALGFKVVVKPHTKEWREDGTGDAMWVDVFGSENYGTTWTFSNQHIFSLAKGAVFAVCFFSTTTTDLVRLGVPVIGRADLRGIPEYDNDTAPRDANGDPALGYRQFGMELPANDFADMLAHARRILENRPRELSPLTAAYNALFPSEHDACRVVVSDICAHLDPRHDVA